MTRSVAAVPGAGAAPLRLHEPPAWFTAAVDSPCRSRIVESGGTPIHYLAWGEPSRPGLLLVHGNGAHARWWSFIAPFLASEYHVAAMDLSGMGDSGWRDRYDVDAYAAETMAVCEHAGFFGVGEPPVIVGHSFGGFVTILTGALHGQGLAGTVIVDSPVNPPGHLRGRPRRAIRPHRTYPSLEAALKRFRLAPPQPCANDYILDYIARHSLRQVEATPSQPEGWAWKFDPAVYRRFSIGDVTQHLRGTQCRIAIMRGEMSVLMPPEVGAYMFELLGRQAPVIEIPQAHHHVMLDQPLAFVAALRALLADWEHSLPTRPVSTPPVPGPGG